MTIKKKQLLRLLRKHKRRTENDAYAKDARFWRNQKSADRIGHDKPVNKQAAKILGAAFCIAALSGFVPSGDLRASPSCMTRAEARAQYPRSHLYWATASHCWGNHSVRRMKFRPRHMDHPRKALIARDQVPTNKDVFDKTASAQSHRVIDINKEIEAKLNECCWPPLDTDANSNINTLELSFAERIKDVPLIWWKQ